MVARQEDQTRFRIEAAVNSSAADNIGTAPVRPELRFDEGRLSAWMQANVADYQGPLRVESFKGGQSNPTYKVITPARNYVLRRKPSGDLLKGAHAVEREARVLTALSGVQFPVPRVYGLCTDDSVIGTWFYVMELVEGRVFWDATFPQVSREHRPLYFDAMNDTIARLHLVDFQHVGLADYGRTGSYFARQIARWSQQYLQDTQAGRDPHMDRLIEWLPLHIPPGDESSIVHGDFRCDNMIFHPTEPRIVAVLDWELSTLGHPLADFTYHAMMYRMPPDIVAGLAGTDLQGLNIPSEAEYIDAYCRRVGRQSIPHYEFYLAFNFFRLAAIFHGIKGRVIRGTASSANAKERAEAFPVLAELAWARAERAG
jgi:aminoglycoside phosphotransferase (APT) family kinase protein